MPQRKAPQLWALEKPGLRPPGLLTAGGDSIVVCRPKITEKRVSTVLCYLLRRVSSWTAADALGCCPEMRCSELRRAFSAPLPDPACLRARTRRCGQREQKKSTSGRKRALLPLAGLRRRWHRTGPWSGHGRGAPASLGVARADSASTSWQLARCKSKAQEAVGGRRRCSDLLRSHSGDFRLDRCDAPDASGALPHALTECCSTILRIHLHSHGPFGCMPAADSALVLSHASRQSLHHQC